MRLRNIPAAYPAIEESPFCVTDGTKVKGKWNTVFPEEHPLYIEVGTGKGRFILENAKRNKDKNYLGIELYESVLYRALQRFLKEEEPVLNLRFLRADANDILDMFEKEEVDGIFLNFSDPWPKKRHAKRRLTSPNFLEKYDKILKQGGVIEFKTDNAGLFEYTKEVLEESKTWKIKEITTDLHNDPNMNEGNIMTEYEEKFSSAGNPIYKVIMEREE
ncbi:MAG: tRNA (guanosine(46)-N7)-methyltransferase TrmB [Lachnospiraceae bacterium]|nr:tRNA (guanosine(46)-N7)-methyltransferase TrmB [Lachnospiraceae bacterium]